MRLLLAAIALCLAAPAVAQQPPPLKLGATEAYHHKPTGLTVPVTLDGLTRTLASAYTPELDEALGFDNPANTETLTVFVFRNVTGSVPVWFDRVDWVASRRDVYGGVTQLHPALPFAPTGRGKASGLITTYAVSRGPYRSTAIAFMPLGPGWYVSLRYSSKTLDPAALETHLLGAVSALGWPVELEPQPAIVPIENCTAALTVSAQAKPASRDKSITGSLLFGALISSADDETKRKMEKDEPPKPATLWCRDIAASAGLQNAGVYRPVGTNDRYLIAYQDAGRGVLVEPDTMSALLTKGAGKPTWSIAEFDLGSVSIFTPRDRLPEPDATRKIVASEPVASKATTWGKDRQITINPDFLQK